VHAASSHLHDLVEGLAVAAELAEGLPATLGLHSFHGERWGFADATGTWVVAPTYKSAYPFSEGLAKVGTSEGFGYIDSAGSIVIAPRFRRSGTFAGGLAHVEDNNLIGYIDAKGAMVIAPQAFSHVSHFSRVEPCSLLRMTAHE
jgi:hypothetical protein